MVVINPVLWTGHRANIKYTYIAKVNSD